MKTVRNTLRTLCTISLFVCAVSTAYALDDVTPTNAAAMTMEDPNVYILDVRTAAEWKWVGHPGVNGQDEGSELVGKVVNISYKIEHAGSFVVNPAFLRDVDELFGDNQDVILITMCRSGVRSVDAGILLENAGYTVFNMVDGFEGQKDDYGYRTVSGWKVDGLPYTYSGAGYTD